MAQKVKEETVSTYTVDELARSKKFHKDVDILRALLDSTKRYTVEKAEETVSKFRKTEVKEG